MDDLILISKKDVDAWFRFHAPGGYSGYTINRWQAKMIDVPFPPERGWVDWMTGLRVSKQVYDQLYANLPKRKYRAPKGMTKRRMSALDEDLNYKESRYCNRP